MTWLYHGEPFTDPGDNIGFVYEITNKITNKKYIGKKFFWSTKRKQVNKIRKRYKAESDWKTYWSSSEELKLDVTALGEENFTREIIHLCKSKGVTNYLEAKEQFQKAVLENQEEWYNNWIMVRVNRSHLTKL
jgi:hypothetical protein